MNKYIAEFIGTFFLVLTIGLTVIEPGAGTLAPVAIGSVLMVMIYAGSHISSAHYNPAVTLAVYLRGRCAAAELPWYMLAQVMGAVLAAIVVGILKGQASVTTTQVPVVAGLLAEFLFTFALCYVILNVATAKKTEGNSYFGLAIGFTVLVGAYAVGDISGGAFNPAVALGITLMGLSSWSSLWIFLVANLGGAAAAAGVFLVLNPDERKREMSTSDSDLLDELISRRP